MARQNWSRDELIVAFNLYCKIPFGRIHKRNPQIVELASLLGRTPSAVSWKLANFARLDPTLQNRSISGASHGGKLEIEIWEEFNHNWEALSLESEVMMAKLKSRNAHERADIEELTTLKPGSEREAVVKLRINQRFFRDSVMAAYGYTCCITGLTIPALLNASHIVPWSVDVSSRVNPRNGLCLNTLHDRAFDRGLLTITENYQVRLSSQLLSTKGDAASDFLHRFQNQTIHMPKRFAPSIQFLRYHNQNIFVG